MSGIANVYLITNAQSSSSNHHKQEGIAGFCSTSAPLSSSLQLFFLSWKLRESAVLIESAVPLTEQPVAQQNLVGIAGGCEVLL